MLTESSGGLRVEIADDGGATIPTPRVADHLPESSRDLSLIAELASEAANRQGGSGEPLHW